jgi:transposase
MYAAQSASLIAVALMTGDTTVKICRRRRRFSAQGLVGLADQPRSGRPSAITPRLRAQIVAR